MRDNNSSSNRVGKRRRVLGIPLGRGRRRRVRIVGDLYGVHRFALWIVDGILLGLVCITAVFTEYIDGTMVTLFIGRVWKDLVFISRLPVWLTWTPTNYDGSWSNKFSINA